MSTIKFNLFKSIICILLIFNIGNSVFAQQNLSIIDSLIKVINSTVADSAKLTAYNTLASEYYQIHQSEKTENVANKMLNLAIENKDELRIADAYNLIGMANKKMGFYEIALENYNKALGIFRHLRNKNGEVVVLNNISLIYNIQGGLNKAVEYQLIALKIKEQLGNKKNISISFNNLGTYYSEYGYYEKANEYYNQALNLCKEINDKRGIANALNNIGTNYYFQRNFEKAAEYYNLVIYIFQELNLPEKLADIYNNLANVYINIFDYDKALEYYNKSLDIVKQNRDIDGVAGALCNIAIVYSSKGDFKKSIDYFLMAHDSLLKINNYYTISEVLCYIGIVYSDLKNYNEAIKYVQESNKIAQKNGYIDVLTNNYKDIAEIYLKSNDYKNAYQNLSLYTLYKDTILNEEKQKQILELQARFETEKKEKEIVLLNKDKVLNKIEIKNKADEIQKQQILIYSFILIAIIVIIFSVFILRLFVQKRKANMLLTKKNIEIEQKNKEINDSINYAKRIQDVMLPNLEFNNLGFSDLTEEVQENSKSFILFKPKDIVSGDFYWLAKVENQLIVAVADCTGHGVPGAFMSLLGISFLNEIVRKKEIKQANQVLNELRKEIINALQQTGELGTQKDGMDMSLAVISQLSKSSELYHAQWAGANNPLWIVSSLTFEVSGLTEKEQSALANDKRQTTNIKLFEMKPDKMPIAIYERMNDFTNHEIQLNSGDILYLMSDGYEDQFGGPKHKKFLSKNLKELIIANCLLTMEVQKQVLEKTLVEWIGEGEQIDDITVMGIKI